MGEGSLKNVVAQRLVWHGQSHVAESIRGLGMVLIPLFKNRTKATVG